MAETTERPIIFTGESIPAILAGRKTQTRRLVDPEKLKVRLPYEVKSDLPVVAMRPGEKLTRAKPGVYPGTMNPQGATCVRIGGELLGLRPGEFNFVSPYMSAGTTRLHNGRWHIEPHGEQRLWVKETWARSPGEHPSDAGVLYRATDPEWDKESTGLKWKPSIFMPRWASRLTLEVISVRAERLQSITEEDANAEGVEPLDAETFRGAFARTWDSIYGEQPGRSWAANPWVWAISFKRVMP